MWATYVVLFSLWITFWPSQANYFENKFGDQEMISDSNEFAEEESDIGNPSSNKFLFKLDENPKALKVKSAEDKLNGKINNSASRNQSKNPNEKKPNLTVDSKKKMTTKSDKTTKTVSTSTESTNHINDTNKITTRMSPLKPKKIFPVSKIIKNVTSSTMVTFRDITTPNTKKTAEAKGKVEGAISNSNARSMMEYSEDDFVPEMNELSEYDSNFMPMPDSNKGIQLTSFSVFLMGILCVILLCLF